MKNKNERSVTVIIMNVIIKLSMTLHIKTKVSIYQNKIKKIKTKTQQNHNT